MAPRTKRDRGVVFEIAMFLGISPDMTILGLVDIGVMSTSSSVASVPKRKHQNQSHLCRLQNGRLRMCPHDGHDF